LSDPADDRVLEDYLHRKSALSMGYRRVYIEAPPPELDRAVTARARRALRWLVPGLLALGIALTLVLGINFGVTKWVGAMQGAEKNLQRLQKEREEKEERERAQEPIAIIVDPGELSNHPAASSQLSREDWLAKIDKLKRAGKKAEAQAEQQRFLAAYPDKPTQSK
jgi:hypothetical protein